MRRPPLGMDDLNDGRLEALRLEAIIAGDDDTAEDCDVLLSLFSFERHRSPAAPRILAMLNEARAREDDS